MNRTARAKLVLAALSSILWLAATPTSFAQQKKPNIVVIMSDDVGIWNISAYHRGMMGGRTPNIDRIAREGALFTDYYAQQSCTAGRAAFILGQTPFRTGMLKVGMPAAKQGLQDKDPTIAELLKPYGYATAQIGKNHLGDRNEYLPTVHGFDEFYGILYHLNAMEEPYDAEYPKDPEFHARFGPRNIVDTRATDVDDPTEHLPRRCHCKLPSSRLSRSNLARKSPEKRGKHRLWRGLLGVDRRTVIEDIEFDELGADGAQLV